MKKELEIEKPNVARLKDPKKMKEDSQNVEMKDVEKTEDTVEEGNDSDFLAVEDIREQVRYIEKAVSSKEPRFMFRVMRGLVSVRRRLNSNVLRKATASFLPATSPAKEGLLKYLDEPMETSNDVRPKSGKVTVLLPEVEVYLHLLLLLFLIDKEKHQQALEVSTHLMSRITTLNRRTLDVLAAKCYFYHARVHELTDRFDTIRAFLHARLRTSTLRSDIEGQASLINLLLRNYLHYSHYEQADKLVSKVTFPELATNNEWARYLYYIGRIRAIHLDYSEAHKNLIQAMRKAPQATAVGFKQTVQKLVTIVELLLGDIPDRAIFRQTSMRKALHPYFLLTQAVRAGHLAQFNQVLQQNKEKFYADGTFTLIIRLRHNVIKTGIRLINLSYSKISLKDIATKLQLDSAEDAEFIVAKSIRDGVIEATINHEHGFVQSKDTVDVYSTGEPMAAFHQRITFCLDIHNQSVKAMRFPPKSYNKDLETAERREREQQEFESAKEIADDDYDGY